MIDLLSVQQDNACQEHDNTSFGKIRGIDMMMEERFARGCMLATFGDVLHTGGGRF